MISELEQEFQQEFGRSPDAIVQSPGRINLIGEHVDYLDGYVLPMAIDRYTFAAASRNNENRIRIKSDFNGGVIDEFPFNQIEKVDGDRSWLNYIIGVTNLFSRKGVEIPGYDMHIRSTLPSEAGLSSSAALTTTTALVIESITKTSISTIERALICQKAEHEFAGVPCGIMDPLVIGASREDYALMIDCSDLQLNYRPLPEGLSIVVADTMVKHSLADGEYKKRREECEKAAEILQVLSLRKASMNQVEEGKENLGDTLYRRARHAVSEMNRVLEFAQALESLDFEAMGSLMRGSHISLRDDFEVSCPELDVLAESAWDWGLDRGLIGSRMTGGGFGGSTVSLVMEEAAEAFMEHLRQSFQASFGKQLQPFVTSSGKGAQVLKCR